MIQYPSGPQVPIEGFDLLVELALNLRWTWNHETDSLWQQIDPELWQQTYNPWTLLQTVSEDKLKAALGQKEFRKSVERLVESNRLEAKTKGWFQENYPKSPLTCVAYFSMEYMLSESLPIYSGGLGNVAGDQLKAASDLDVPVVAVGLLYQEGYFRQVISKDGAQEALYPYNDPGQLPIRPCRKPTGEWVRIEINLPGWPLWIRVWEVQVGRRKLLLLDSNDPANNPVYRGITNELYGGGPELRLRQELVLGLAGWRALEALGYQPEVCHLNEGHAAFAILERAAHFMVKNNVPFELALEATRAGNLFTTHTAVSAGFDRFPPNLIEQYLKGYAKTKLGISLQDLLKLGRANPNDYAESFNMAFLAMRGSGCVNGVSRLHGEVSRHIFEPLFPRWPTDDIPIGYVTNGVHVPSWDSLSADQLWQKACGPKRWQGDAGQMQEKARAISDEEIWRMRNLERKNLVEYARKRLAKQIGGSGGSFEDVELIKRIFDPNTLTIGFARRFATYKRPNMLLQNPERLLRLLKHAGRPVQLIIAGKAHPADKAGQALIQDWIRFIRRPEVRPHIMFLADYDMLLTKHLVQGVDVWINTPRRPWEACGTSGMKVLANGGLNVSELDGWWVEAFTPEVGWALGDGQERESDPVWDRNEANALYDLLEGEIVPSFYDRDSEGLPRKWIAKIRESMACLTPQYSANRAVREYTEQHYLKAAENFAARQKNDLQLTKQIVQWQNILKEKWGCLRFSLINIKTDKNQIEFEVHVYLDELDPKNVQLELYASTPIVKQVMNFCGPLKNDPGTYIYRAKLATSRPAKDFTPRIVPYFPGVNVPLEASEILWQQ